MKRRLDELPRIDSPQALGVQVACRLTRIAGDSQQAVVWQKVTTSPWRWRPGGRTHGSTREYKCIDAGERPVILRVVNLRRVGTAHHNTLCFGGRCPPYILWPAAANDERFTSSERSEASGSSESQRRSFAALRMTSTKRVTSTNRMASTNNRGQRLDLRRSISSRSLAATSYCSEATASASCSLRVRPS